MKIVTLEDLEEIIKERIEFYQEWLDRKIIGESEFSSLRNNLWSVHKLASYRSMDIDKTSFERKQEIQAEILKAPKVIA